MTSSRPAAELSITGFAELIASAASALKERRDEVNKLNVFPVPDGDTGTNMSLTMDAVVAEIERASRQPPRSRTSVTRSPTGRSWARAATPVSS